ncbi:hypothetical protein LAV60_15570 [Clostridium sporogenes]|uniref:hypothetical protein n=1 Tax=Clostridium sporogenes TaxID=1509 RepID=UPI0022385423|nr:hypothetical protein [Clostridium sporogenes]MCW6094590.1 hypothetical protein [Clostridium sporogenes]
MDKLVGVVNRPQFDKNVFDVGKAVRIRQFANNGYELMSRDCIITDNNPMYLCISYYDEDDYEFIDRRIDIVDVVDGTYTISLLREEM